MAKMEELKEASFSNIVIWNNYQRLPSKDIFGVGVRGERFVLVKKSDPLAQRFLFILLRCLNIIKKDPKSNTNLYDKTIKYLTTPDVIAFLKILAGIDPNDPAREANSILISDFSDYDHKKDEKIRVVYQSNVLPQPTQSPPVQKIEQPQNSKPEACNHKEEIDQLRKQVQDLEQSNTSLKSTLENQEKLTKEIEKLKASNEKKQNELNNALQENNIIKGENAALQKALSDLKQHLQSEQEKNRVLNESNTTLTNQLEKVKSNQQKALQEIKFLKQPLEQLQLDTKQQQADVKKFIEQLKAKINVSKEESLLKDKEKQIEELEKELKAARELTNQQKISLEDLSKQLEGILKLTSSSETSDFTSLLNQGKLKIQELNRQIQELEARRDALIKLIESLQDPNSRQFQALVQSAVNKKGFLGVGKDVLRSAFNKTRSTTSLLDDL